MRAIVADAFFRGQFIRGASFNVQWASSAPQISYRILVLDGAAIVYDSGTIASAALSASVPTTNLKHDHEYTLRVESTSDLGLVGADEMTFHFLSAPPATPANLVATAVALAGDIEPTAVRLTWDASSEPDFAHYRITRQATEDGDDGLTELELGTIDAIGTTTFDDRFPASGIPYTYRVRTVINKGLGQIASAAASATAELTLTTVVLATTGFGVDLRVPLRYVESSDVGHTDDTSLLIPWGETKPTIYEGDANYRVITATFALVSDGAATAEAGLAVLRQMNRSKPKPIVCYRDDRGRKLFGTTTLQESDRELAWYSIGLTITETNFGEGEAD